MIYFIPAILVESRTAQDHLVLVSSYLVGLYYLIKVAFEGKKTHLVMLGLAWGIFLGIKISAPMYLLITLTVFLFINWEYKNKFYKLVIENAKWIIVALLLILILGGYWFVKNMIISNQIINFQEASRVIASEESDAFQFALGALDKFATNWIYLPARVTDRANRYTPDLVDISGFGIQFFSLGILGIISAYFIYSLTDIEVKKRRLIKTLFWLAILIQLVYFLFYWTPYNYRLFMLTPIIAILLWALLFVLLDFNKTQINYFDLLLVLIVVFNLITTFFSENTHPEKLKNMIFFPADRRTMINYSVHLGTDWGFIDHYIPSNETIAYSPRSRRGPDTFIAPFIDNNLKRSIFFLQDLHRLIDINPEERPRRFKQVYNQMKQTLNQNGIKFIYVYELYEPIINGDQDFIKLYPHLYFYSPD